MILPIITEISDHNNNIFDCVTLKNEITVTTYPTELLGYMVTVYPRNENINDFNFVYGLFVSDPIAFNINQSTVIHFATEMFSKSEPLGSLESDILNETFKRIVKTVPTLSGRK